MDTKLTLKLSQEIIEKAKLYASSKKVSLSRIVEAYLQSITSDEKNEQVKLSPFVKSLSSGLKLPTDLDYKNEYAKHLNEKHQ